MKTTLKMSAVQTGKFKQMKSKIVQRKQYYQDLFVMLGAAAALYKSDGGFDANIKSTFYRWF